MAKNIDLCKILKDVPAGTALYSTVHGPARYLMIVMAAVLMGACSTVRTIPVVEHHTDTLREMVVRLDSIHVHDSVTIERLGDTVTVTRWRDRIHVKMRVDSFVQIKRDSIPYPVEVPVEVERKLTAWQKVRMTAGDFAMMLLAVVAVLFLIKNRRVF